MSLSRISNLVEGTVLPVLFFIQAANAAYTLVQEIEKGLNFVLILNGIIRPLLFAIFLFNSSPKIQKVVDNKIFLGILLSYIPFFFLDFNPKINDQLFSDLALILNVFYILILIISLTYLKNEFTILPGFKRLQKSGLYAVVRHPIYSSYIHLGLLYVIINPHILNTVCVVLIFIGLELRSSAEEQLIFRFENEYYNLMPKTKFFHFALSVPLLCLAIYACFKPTNSKTTLNVNIAYPIYSLTPHYADDWSSFFVMNHIYPRFNSRPGTYRSNSIFKSRRVVCETPSHSPYSQECGTVNVHYEIKENLKGCNGQPYTTEHFQTELKKITDNKNWIFPGFQRCGDGCFSFQNVKNIQDHFDSIYLRFGWSLNNEKSARFGIEPNCLSNIATSEDTLSEGVIETFQHQIKVSTKVNEFTDIILYGNKPDDTKFQTLNFYNPIYFYLISKDEIPSTFLESIAEVFLDNNVISKTSINTTASAGHERNFEIVIPDYLENCPLLSSQLEKKIRKAKFICSNISFYTESIVKKGKPWSSFISPLTPGMPGKEGITEQYFSKDSSDNWLGASPERTQVFLIGELSGLLQVKNKKICSIRPNSLGLSDITIDDFIICD